MRGGLTPWLDGLAEAGARVSSHSPDNRRAPDLAVAPAALAGAAVGAGAAMLVLEGAVSRSQLERAGFALRRYLLRPARELPNFMLPLEQPAAASYAVERWSTSDRLWRKARNRALGALFRAGLSPQVGAVTTVALRRPGAPAVLAAAERFGIPSGSGWFLTFGQGDELSRNVFHVFAPRARAPGWVVKFARVPGYTEPFDRDERGLQLAERAGGVVAEHAPRLLGRLDLDGLHASVETAAPGERLMRLLQSPGRRPAKLSAIDAVAAWAVELAGTTRQEPAALDPERGRLLADVVPRWAALGASEDLVRGLPPVAPVLQHNDLGSWNVVHDGSRFTAVDWESARPAGLPLWDLVYFLTDALAVLDGVADARRDDHAARLFRGELESSSILFRWLRKAVAGSGTPAEAVGQIVTLCWLHHGLSHLGRASAVDRFAPSGRAGVPPLERVARVWLSDPALGPGWDRWRAT